MSSLLTPPLSPERGQQPPGEPEALIAEARRRGRRRRLGIAVLLIATAAVAAALYGWFADARHGARSASSGGAAARRECPGVDLGLVAFIRRADALKVLDLTTCSVRTLVRGRGVGAPAFSSDGRYLSFSGGYVATRGGPVHHLGGGSVWSPRADVLAVVTPRGGLELLNVTNGKRRRLLPAGWGAGDPVFSPDGRMLAVTRHAKPRRALKPVAGRLINPWGLQVWVLDLSTGHRRLVLSRQVSEQPIDLSFAPNGQWLIAHEYPDAASLGADGMPLVALNVDTGKVIEIGRTLAYPNLMTWCGGELVYATDFGGRVSTMGEGVAAAAPPTWHSTTLLASGGRMSWSSLDCTSTGQLLIAAGPASADSPFGQEHRALYRLRLGTHTQPQLIGEATPSKKATDELPLWSASGNWLLFVRTNPSTNPSTATVGRGILYAVDLQSATLVGPIANVGQSGDYYGSYNWADQIAWHRG